MMRYVAFSASLIHTIFSFGQNQSYKTVKGIKGDFLGYGSLNVKHNIELTPNVNSALEYVFEDLLLNSSIETGPYLFITHQFNFVCGSGFALSYVIN